MCMPPHLTVLISQMSKTTAQHDEADIIVLPHQQSGPPQPGVWTPWTVHDGEFYPSFYALW